MKKKLFSLLLAGALTVSFAVSASAASVTASVSQNSGQITVSGAVSDAVSGQQVTILVVKDGTELSELTSSDVAYIDQVSATGDYAVTFQMPTAMNYGTYDVYVGGSEVTTLATTEFVVEGSRTVSGNVAASAVGADLTKIWIRVYTAGTETLVAEDYADENGAFSLYVPDGTYDIKVGRVGYLVKTYSNVTVSVDDSSTVNGLTLFAGDVDADGSINVSDVTELIAMYGKDPSLTPQVDFDDDSSVNASDLNALIAKYGKQY